MPHISEDWTFDRLFDCPKHNVRFALLTTTVATFEEAKKVALLLDSALCKEYSCRREHSTIEGQQGQAFESNERNPMEIGNLQRRKRRALINDENCRDKGISRIALAFSVKIQIVDTGNARGLRQIKKKLRKDHTT